MGGDYFIAIPSAHKTHITIITIAAAIKGISPPSLPIFVQIPVLFAHPGIEERKHLLCRAILAGPVPIAARAAT